MKNELNEALDLLEKEKNIKIEYVYNKYFELFLDDDNNVYNFHFYLNEELIKGNQYVDILKLFKRRDSQWKTQ